MAFPNFVIKALEKRSQDPLVQEQKDLHLFDSDLVTTLPNTVTLVNESDIKHHVGSCYQIFMATHPDLAKFETPSQIKAIEDLGGEIESIILKICLFAPIILIYGKQTRIHKHTPKSIEQELAYSDEGKTIQNQLINLFSEKNYQLLNLSVAQSLIPGSTQTVTDQLFHKY